MIIDPINRVPSWNNKLANEERNRREAMADFEHAQRLSRDQARRVKFWMGVSAVLAVVLVVKCL
jgi:hypothetical protein